MGLTLLIKHSVLLTTVLVGELLNSLLIWLIIKHTPTMMRLYSRILLQTCVTDSLLLFFYLFADGIMLQTSYGAAICETGLFWWIAPNVPILIAFFFFIMSVFLIHLSFFGFLSQFIYRFLTLIRINGDAFSTKKYFGMFALIAIFPLVFTVLFSIALFPSEEVTDKITFQNESIAPFFDLNQNMADLKCFPVNNQLPFSIAIFYNVLIYLVAYVILLVLGWKMHRYTAANLQLTGVSSQQRKSAVLNRQLNRVLIIQAILPFWIYLSQLIIISQSTFGNYLPVSLQDIISPFCTFPTYAPAAINPMVAILLLRPYREAIARLVRQTFTN